MTTWDLGDRVPLRHRVYDADGELVDATVSLTVIAPDGTITTPAVTHTSLGTYDASVLATQVGQWRYIWAVSGTVVDTQTDTFDVGDPAPLLYYSLDRLKHRLSIDPDDPTRDEELTEFLDAASRGIETNTNRLKFWLDPTPTARVYSVAGRVSWVGRDYVLEVDDIGSTVGMIVEIGSSRTGIWTAVTDYVTGPDNALADRRAIETLRRRGGWGCDEARVTARGGWPAMPAVVQQATQLQASRLNHRRDSPAGFVGTPDIGLVRLGRLDPDVEVLLEKLRKIPIG